MTDGRTLARGAVWSVTGIIVGLVSNLAFSAIIYRAFGADDFGRYLLVVTVLAFLAALQTGLPQFVVRGLAQEGGGASASPPVVGAVTLHYVLAALTTTVAALAAVLFAAQGESTLAAVVLVQAVALSITTLNVPQGSYATASEAWGLILLSQIAGSVVKISSLALLLSPLGLVSAAVASAIGAASEAVTLRLLLRRFSIDVVRPRLQSLRELKPVFGFSLPILVLGFIGYLLSSGGTLILGLLLSPAAVATFRIGASLPVQAQSILQSLFALIFPRVSAKSDDDDRRQAMLTATRPLNVLAGATFASLAVASPAILTLIYGQVDSSVKTIGYLMCAAFLIDFWFHSPVVYATIRGDAGKFAQWSPVELVFNLPLTFLLIALLGIIGAPMVTLLTVLFTNFVIYPHLAPKVGGIGLRILWRRAIRPSIATAFPVAIACFMVSRVVSGGITLIASCVVIGVIVAGIGTRRDAVLLLSRHQSA